MSKVDKKHIIKMLNENLIDHKILYEKYVEAKGYIPWDVFVQAMSVYASRVGLVSVYSSFAEISVLYSKEGVVIKYL